MEASNPTVVVYIIQVGTARATGVRPLEVQMEPAPLPPPLRVPRARESAGG